MEHFPTFTSIQRAGCTRSGYFLSKVPRYSLIFCLPLLGSLWHCLYHYSWWGLGSLPHSGVTGLHIFLCPLSYSPFLHPCCRLYHLYIHGLLHRNCLGILQYLPILCILPRGSYTHWYVVTLCLVSQSGLGLCSLSSGGWYIHGFSSRQHYYMYHYITLR